MSEHTEWKRIPRCCTAGSRGENPVNSQLIITLTQYLSCQTVENAFLQISLLTDSMVKEISNLKMTILCSSALAYFI